MLTKHELEAVIETLEAEIAVPVSDKLTYNEKAIIDRYNAKLISAKEKLENELKYY